MTEQEKREADELFYGFSTYASLTGYLSSDQVNYMFQKHGDFTFCHGHGRRVRAEPISDKTFKIYSEPNI